MILPLCNLNLSVTNVASTVVQTCESYIDTVADSEFVFESENLVQRAAGTSVPSAASEALSLTVIALGIVYLVGLVLAWCHFVLSLAGLFHTLYKGRRVYDNQLPDNVKLIVSDKAKMPFSWFNRIVISERDYLENSHTILCHEMQHVRLMHSLDILMCESVCRMQWFNPFVWLLRRDLRDVHEYQADHAVIDAGINKEEYSNLLVDKTAEKLSMPFANCFAKSSVRQRITMLFSKESKKVAKLKVLLVMPLTAFVLISFARPDTLKRVDQVIADQTEKVEELIAHHATVQCPSVTEEVPVADPADKEDVVLEVPADEPVVKHAPRPTVAEDGNPIYYEMPANVNKNILYSGFYIDRTGDETLVTCVATCESDDEWYWFGGDQTYIEDVDTGDHYKARRVVNASVVFGEGGFHVVGMKGKTWALTMAFPPLPESVERIGFWHLCSWENHNVEIYYVKDIS